MSAVVKAIGDRRLVYVGIRRGDASSLAALPQLSHVISLTDHYEGRDGVVAQTLEILTGLRIDVDAGRRGAALNVLPSSELRTAGEHSSPPVAGPDIPLPSAPGSQ